MKKYIYGFTLTEMAIVLGILGFILGAIWVAASSAYESSKITRTNAQIMSIAHAIRDLYAGRLTMESTAVVWPDISPQLVSTGVFPSDMPIVNDPVTGLPHPTDLWGGQVIVYEDSVTLTDFSISYLGLPQSACIKLLIASSGRSAIGDGLRGIGGGSTIWLDAASFPNGMSPTQAATICDVAANSYAAFNFSLH
jgi:prepilin-type N-terminal cleavage/methylation domain-containing protein